MSTWKFSLAALLLLFSSCGGTEAGNPSVATNLNPTSAAALPANVAGALIVSTICNKLIQCNPSLSLASCTSGVEKQTNLTPAFGVPASFGDFSNIIQTESGGTLNADPVRIQTCVGDIQAQACASATVSGAYSATAPTSFTSVINMIPTSGTSCAGVF